MPDRTPLIAGNWKMHKTRLDTSAFLDEVLPGLDGVAGVEPAICPPLTSLAVAAERCSGTPLRVVAQNMHAEPQGAFTGEVSATMLTDAGAWGTLLGHSERRQLFGESDEALAAKLPAALDAGLVPILCVGETEAERDADETETVLRRQIEADLADLPAERLADVVIAYEPIWAIGTGRTATPAQAQEAIALIRALIARRDAGAAEGVRVLYGGSVKSENAAELLAEADIDGALVGGASLDPQDFLAICAAVPRS
jgi:triosephosphate isomerase